MPLWNEMSGAHRYPGLAGSVNGAVHGAPSGQTDPSFVKWIRSVDRRICRYWSVEYSR